MKTITQLIGTIGPKKFVTRTNRLQLDSDCSVAIRTIALGPGTGRAVAVLFMKRSGQDRQRVTAALFLDWIDEKKFVPYAFFHREQGTNLYLYRRNSRGRVVGIRPAFRHRLEELARNWDAEIMNALNLKRFMVPTLRLVKS